MKELEYYLKCKCGGNKDDCIDCLKDSIEELYNKSIKKSYISKLSDVVAFLRDQAEINKSADDASHYYYTDIADEIEKEFKNE